MTRNRQTRCSQWRAGRQSVRTGGLISFRTEVLPSSHSNGNRNTKAASLQDKDGKEVSEVKTILNHSQLRLVLSLSMMLLFASQVRGSELDQRWTEDQANQWYGHQPWLVGANFLPSDAVNELEMWQGSSFDAKEIDRELGWAESLGMNTMRVFLHNLVWEQDSAGFQHRIDQ